MYSANISTHEVLACEPGHQIDERPTYRSGYKPLTNFGYNDWTTAEAENSGGTWEGVNAIADNSIAMVNSSSNTLAGPYSYNSWNSYTDEWFAAS